MFMKITKPLSLQIAIHKGLIKIYNKYGYVIRLYRIYKYTIETYMDNSVVLSIRECIHVFNKCCGKLGNIY